MAKNKKSQAAGQDPMEVAKKVGVPFIETEKVVDRLVPDMIMSCYRANPKDERDRKINEKVKKAFQDLYPNSMFEEIPTNVRSTFLVGPPGHGKTTAFREAAKKAAEAMGMEFVEDLKEDTKIDENTYLFISEEFSGETSKMGVGGIPGKRHEELEDGTEVEYMIHLMPRRIAMLQKAGGGVFLLDDFTNASKAVQNIGLSLSLEKRYQATDIGNSYVALTGNLGAIDGTNTSTASTALLNRLRMYFVQDNPENFLHRGQKKYKGNFGDLGILGFLDGNESFFTEFPSPRQMGPFATPRSWDAFIESAISSAAVYGSAKEAVFKIKLDAMAFLGSNVSGAFNNYFETYLDYAEPLAKHCLSENVKVAEVKKQYESSFDTVSKEGQDFLHQFSTALVDNAVRNIVKDKDGKLDKVVERFAVATEALPDSSVESVVYQFKRKLANQMDELSILDSQNRRDLSGSAKEKISDILDKSKTVDKDLAKKITDALEKTGSSFANTRRKRPAKR